MKINSLSMVAEDHAESKHNAAAIYNCIRQPLVSDTIHTDRKLPLVYVIDSILKNVKGKFVPIIEKDAKEWMPVVHHALPEDKRAKLKKVWNLWKDAGVFDELSWKEMGSCFSGSSIGDQSAFPELNTKLEKAGITWGVRQFCVELHLAAQFQTKFAYYATNIAVSAWVTERWGFAAHAQTSR